MISPIPLEFTLCEQNFLLLPQKAIFWIDEQALIVADVHLGKVGHFRKAGIAIPRSMEQEDLAVLTDIVCQYKPQTIIFLGDLFHSDMNNDWAWFILWRDLHKDVDMILVRGNHDILHIENYEKCRFIMHDTLTIGPFLFSHEPLTNKQIKLTEEYVLSGHIHPGVKLKGKGRQSITLPCFHFGKKQALVPAFGKFTGSVCVKCQSDDRVFGVLKHKVIAL
ncbi:MAG: ligase-associated DNA damage response endonuclease PdeM [Daejeonella sp.]